MTLFTEEEVLAILYSMNQGPFSEKDLIDLIEFVSLNGQYYCYIRYSAREDYMCLSHFNKEKQLRRISGFEILLSDKVVSKISEGEKELFVRAENKIPNLGYYLSQHTEQEIRDLISLVEIWFNKKNAKKYVLEMIKPQKN